MPGRRRLLLGALIAAVVLSILGRGCGSGQRWYRCTEQQCSNDAPRTGDYCITDESIKSAAQ